MFHIFWLKRKIRQKHRPPSTSHAHLAFRPFPRILRNFPLKYFSLFSANPSRRPFPRPPQNNFKASWKRWKALWLFGRFEFKSENRNNCFCTSNRYAQVSLKVYIRSQMNNQLMSFAQKKRCVIFTTKSTVNLTKNLAFCCWKIGYHFTSQLFDTHKKIDGKSCAKFHKSFFQAYSHKVNFLFDGLPSNMEYLYTKPRQKFFTSNMFEIVREEKGFIPRNKIVWWKMPAEPGATVTNIFSRSRSGC